MILNIIGTITVLFLWACVVGFQFLETGFKPPWWQNLIVAFFVGVTVRAIWG